MSNRDAVIAQAERFMRAIEQPGSPIFATGSGMTIAAWLRLETKGVRRFGRMMIRERHTYDHRETDEQIGERIYAFIDIESGDILKPEGWRKPAQHPRGNLFDEDMGIAGVNWYGPKYMDDPTLPARYRRAA